MRCFSGPRQQPRAKLLSACRVFCMTLLYTEELGRRRHRGSGCPVGHVDEQPWPQSVLRPAAGKTAQVRLRQSGDHADSVDLELRPEQPGAPSASDSSRSCSKFEPVSKGRSVPRRHESRFDGACIDLCRQKGFQRTSCGARPPRGIKSKEGMSTWTWPRAEWTDEFTVSRTLRSRGRSLPP